MVTGKIKSCGCSIKTNKGKNHRLWRGCGDISGNRWNSIVRGANGSKGRKKIMFDITIEEVWELYLNQNRKCKLSGLPISFSNDKIRGTASLDRIDSSKGYEKGNIQWVHKDINKMKNSLDETYFINLCHKVSELNQKRQCDL